MKSDSSEDGTPRPYYAQIHEKVLRRDGDSIIMDFYEPYRRERAREIELNKQRGINGPINKQFEPIGKFKDTIHALRK